MKKEATGTESEWKYKAEAYCSLTERCIAEVETKLAQWGATPEATTNIIHHLQTEKYIDQQRFCTAFVRDKYRFNQWGRMKIVQALRMKKIPAELIATGLEAIDEHEYLDILADLIARKKKSIKARTDYERNAKLIRFALSRGFETEAVLKCVKQEDGYEEFID